MYEGLLAFSTLKIGCLGLGYLGAGMGRSVCSKAQNCHYETLFSFSHHRNAIWYVLISNPGTFSFLNCCKRVIQDPF